MSYLDGLKKLKTPHPPSAKSAKSAIDPTFGTFGTTPTGHFQNIDGTRLPADDPTKSAESCLFDAAAPPPLTPADREAIREVIDERAAILEFDAGLSRPVAETQAAEAMRVYRYRLTDRPDWLILIAPGCDLAEARRTLVEKFGAARLLGLTPHPDPKETLTP